MSIRDYQVAADRSSLMTTIGHRVTLIKGGRANGALFFCFGRSSNGGRSARVRITGPAKKPVRNDFRTHVTRRICASDLHMVRSLTGATFIPPLSAVVFFPSFFSRLVSVPPRLVQVRWTHRWLRPLVSSRGLREKGGAPRPRGGIVPGRPNFNRAYKSFE